MKAELKQFGWLLLMVSCAAAQNAPASLQGVKVVRTENGIQVNVSVSDRIQPTVVTATNPDRLVLDFANTTAGVKQQRISVDADGVRAVRFGLHSSEPAITRVVIDLDSAHPYQLQSNGTQISLTLGHPAKSKATVHYLPPPAASERIHRDISTPPGFFSAGCRSERGFEASDSRDGDDSQIK